jgi:putative Holliday junction resolvase
MNILAIDFGTKNIGLAWCETNIGVVLPYGIIRDQKISELFGLIKKEKIERVIVGLPIGLDNKENTNTVRVRKFIEELRPNIPCPVEFFDERFSSAQADRMGEGASRDEKSAMIILEDYLNSKKRSI